MNKDLDIAAAYLAAAEVCTPKAEFTAMTPEIHYAQMALFGAAQKIRELTPADAKAALRKHDEELGMRVAHAVYSAIVRTGLGKPREVWLRVIVSEQMNSCASGVKSNALEGEK